MEEGQRLGAADASGRKSFGSSRASRQTQDRARAKGEHKGKGKGKATNQKPSAPVRTRSR